MQKSTNDKNQHMVNEKFILWEVLMKKKLLSLLLASAMVVSMVCACGSDKSSELSQAVKDTKETEEKKLVWHILSFMLRCMWRLKKDILKMKALS